MCSGPDLTPLNRLIAWNARHFKLTQHSAFVAVPHCARADDAGELPVEYLKPYYGRRRRDFGMNLKRNILVRRPDDLTVR